MQVLTAFCFIIVGTRKCKNQCTPTSESADPLINNLWKPNCDSRQKRQNARRQIPPVPLACRTFSVCKQACKHDPRHCRHQPEADLPKCCHHKNPFLYSASYASNISARAPAPIKRHSAVSHSREILRFARKSAAVKQIKKNRIARTTQAA